MLQSHQTIEESRMTFPAESSSPYQVYEQEAGTKKPLPPYIKYIICAVLVVVVLSIVGVFGYRAHRKKHGLTKPEHVFPPSKCDMFDFKQIPAMPEVEGDYEVPASISEALEPNNFERLKVVPRQFSIEAEGCEWPNGYDSTNYYPYNPKLSPYVITENNEGKYHREIWRGAYMLVKWTQEGANTLTIFHFPTQRLGDYKYQTENPSRFHLIPSLNAVAIIDASSEQLSEIILLKDGKSLMGKSLNGAEQYILDSEYFYTGLTSKAGNLFTLIDNKMEDLGSIETKSDIFKSEQFVEPGVCAFILEELDSSSTSLTVNRYAYDAESKKFGAPTPILINLGLEEDEILYFKDYYPKLWHLSTDKTKTTFEFMLGFSIYTAKPSITRSYTTVKINDSEVVGSPAPLLRGVDAIDKNTLYYEDTKAEVKEIFKRKGTVPSA